MHVVSEAKASHSQRMWAEVSSFTPHLLHNGLSSSPSPQGVTVRLRHTCFGLILCLGSAVWSSERCYCVQTILLKAVFILKH